MFVLRASFFSVRKILTRQLSSGRQFLLDKFRNLGKGDVILEKIKSNNHDIAVVSLSNSKSRNALSGKMMVDLAEIVDKLEQWREGKAVILKGENGTFCSGADLAVAKYILSHEEGEMMSCLMHDTMSRLNQLPLISVAVIEGLAIGGGAELVVSCDFRLMTNNAVVQYVQAKMGVTPGWGGGAQLVDLVGRQQALKILTSCMKIDARQAKEIGFVDGSLEENLDIVEQTCDWLSPYLQSPPSIVQAMKKVVIAGSSKTLAKSLQIERDIFKTMWSGKENLKAFEKVLKSSK